MKTIILCNSFHGAFFETLKAAIRVLLEHVSFHKSICIRIIQVYMQSYVKQTLCNVDFKETNFMKYDYCTIYYLSQGYLIATSPTSYKQMLHPPKTGGQRK